MQLYGASFSLDVMEDWRAHATTQLAELIAKSPVADLSVSSDVHLARAYEKIPALVTEGGYDLVVLGTHGASYAEELLLGGTADRVMRRVRCSVLAVKADSFVYQMAGDVRVSG